MWLGEYAVDHDIQLVLATHSEHLLAGLLWQVREEVLAPADLTVNYFTLEEKGNTDHRRLDVTSGGGMQGSFREFFSGPDIPEWPEFFKGLGRD